MCSIHNSISIPSLPSAPSGAVYLTPKPKFSDVVVNPGERLCDCCEQTMSFIDFIPLRGDSRHGFFICRKCISNPLVERSIREHDLVLSKITMSLFPLKVIFIYLKVYICLKLEAVRL